MIFGIIINIHERQHCHSSGDAPVSLHPARVISSKGMLYGATNDSEHTCSACTAARPTVGLRSTTSCAPGDSESTAAFYDAHGWSHPHGPHP